MVVEVCCGELIALSAPRLHLIIYNIFIPPVSVNPSFKYLTLSCVYLVCFVYTYLFTWVHLQIRYSPHTCSKSEEQNTLKNAEPSFSIEQEVEPLVPAANS